MSSSSIIPPATPQQESLSRPNATFLISAHQMAMLSAMPIRILKTPVFLSVCTGVASLAIMTANASAQTPRSLPAEVNLRPQFDRLGFSARSQGKRDTCSLFAVTALAEYELARSSDSSAGRLSEEFLIWAANEATGLHGDQAMFYEAVQGLNVLGICSANLMPYAAASDAHRQPSAASLADARTRRLRWKVTWIKRWDLKMPLTDAELLGMKESLALGHPVACGLRWPKKLHGHSLRDVPPPEGVFDGHSIAFVGYRDDPGQNGGGMFVFRNSSGPNWGDHGYGTLSYAYARAYANDAFRLEFGSPGCEAPIERFEAEAMSVTTGEHGRTVVQDMGSWGAPMWSHGKQLLCQASSGGFVELGFVVRRGGRYRVCVLATAAPDYGRVGVTIDGAKRGSVFDLYAGRVCPAGELELGVHTLGAGRHTLRFTVAGKTSASSNTFFGIDAVDLRSAD